MCAIMGRLDLACYVVTGLVGVDIEGAEELADVMEWFELGREYCDQTWCEAICVMGI